ncbi:MAG: recombinase family protein [Clostridia bacterium]|nr:recombinase family protein [Clostridia bacterium]
MKIAACYIRVSTDDQTEYSPDSQLRAIRDYAKTHDYYLPEEYVFTDEGISGRTVAKRPAFNRMIGVARQKPKPFEAILLWKFSRFARNRSDAIVYKRLLRDDCGIDVISISENLGEDRGTALILESMFEAMDEYYSINLSTEVKRSMLLKAERGEVLGPAPFGYKNENKTFVIDEEAAPFVRMIFDELEAGTPAMRIAKKLNDLGARTKFGNPFDARAVVYTARNPAYVGMVRWSKNGQKSNGETYRRIPQPDDDLIVTRGTHPPIISRAQFDRVNEKLNDRARLLARGSRECASREYALHGLVRCSNCGATLTYASAKEPALQCHKYAKSQCSVSHHVSLKILDRAVLDALKKATQTMAFAIVPSRTVQEESDRIALARILESEHRRLEKARDAFELGIDTAEEFRQRKDEITKAIRQTEARLSTFDSRQVDREQYRRRILDVISVLEDPTASPHAQNQALRTIIERITFHRATCSVDLIFHA